MAKEDDSIFRKAADSTLALIISRVSGPLLLAVFGWGFHTLNDLQVNVAGLSAGLTATVGGISKRLDNVEDRIGALENSNAYGLGNVRRSTN